MTGLFLVPRVEDPARAHAGVSAERGRMTTIVRPSGPAVMRLLLGSGFTLDRVLSCSVLCRDRVRK